MSGAIFPTITHVGSQPLYGTGSGGSNPTFSTITMTLPGSVGWDIGNSSTMSLVYDQILSTGGVPVSTLVFELNRPGLDSGLPLGVGALNVIGTGSVGSTNSGAITLNNDHFELRAPVGGDIQLYSPTYISSLNVSSINGQAPGSATVPANLSLSTLTMNGGIDMLNNTIKFDTGGQSVHYYNAGDNNTYLTGASTYMVAIGTQSNTEALQVRDSSVTIPVSLLATNQPMTVSSLTVSSINSGPLPPVITAVGLSNFAGDTASVPGGNNAYPLSQNFTVATDHTYRISQSVSCSNSDSGTYTTFAVSGPGGGFPVFIDTFLNQNLVQSLNGGSKGIQTVFKSFGSGTAQVVCYNNSATLSTLVEVPSSGGNYQGWLLEDMGIVL